MLSAAKKGVLMNSEPWKGSKIPDYPRVLILGESHYDEANYGEKVSFPTSGVVRRYFETREKWSQFFDKIAASFGYEKPDAKQFYEKVFFGNYIDVVCGIGGNNNARHYADLNRPAYNDDWFGYVNENEIDIVLCFSKLVYNHFPSLNKSVVDEKDVRVDLGKIGSKTNYAEICLYKAAANHPHCNIRLEKDLLVYGIRHPSMQGGYNSEQVYNFLARREELRAICHSREEVQN